MKNLIRFSFAAFVATILVANVAQALPEIDSAVRSFLSNPADNETALPVILVFKDKIPVNNSSFSPMGRPMMEAVMMKNAQVSQENTIKIINSLKTRGTTLLTRDYWFINAMGVYTTQNNLKQIIANNNDIALVNSNRRFKIIDTKDEPTRAQGEHTYGLNNMQVPELNKARPDIDGRGVKVGILDTGIDAQHPDLKGKVLIFKDFINGQTTPYDDHSHGTHVAGTIAGGNTSGTAIGVAPGAKLIIGKIFDSSGGASEANILQAMQWITNPSGNIQANDAPNLVSNSWGGGGPNENTDPANDPQCRAVDAWVKLGIMPVFAAGNSGPGQGSVGLPGGCPNAVAVGATDETDKIASFSSRGPAVWKTGSFIKPVISAPGVRVYSSIPGGKYGIKSGTSMATPHTSGLAALIYQVAPHADVAAATKMLIAGSDHMGDAGQNNTFGWGRINAFKTMKALFGSH